MDDTRPVTRSTTRMSLRIEYRISLSSCSSSRYNYGTSFTTPTPASSCSPPWELGLTLMTPIGGPVPFLPSLKLSLKHKPRTVKGMLMSRSPLHKLERLEPTRINILPSLSYMSYLNYSITLFTNSLCIDYKQLKSDSPSVTRNVKSGKSALLRHYILDNNSIKISTLSTP